MIGEPQGQYLPFLWLTISSLIVGAIAFWGVRRAIVPLSVFASAAERLGVDVNAAPLSEEGPSEVHRAAGAEAPETLPVTPDLALNSAAIVAEAPAHEEMAVPEAAIMPGIGSDAEPAAVNAHSNGVHSPTPETEPISHG